MNSIENTILLTGLPRAGTTLCCHILNSHENVLALHEPLSPVDFDASLGKKNALKIISEFAKSTRNQVLEKGVALTRQKDGTVPENPVTSSAIEGGLRQIDVSLGEIDVSRQIQNSDFTLAIKHNALFTSLLPELLTEFPVFGIVRNPLAVLASWNLVDLPVNNGRVPAGEMFAPDLKKLLDSTADAIERQLHILEWFCSVYANNIHDKVIRYEDFVAQPSHIGHFLQLKIPYGGSINSRNNRNAEYNLELMDMLHKRLMHYGDAIWQFYTRDQVNLLMEDIRAAA